jgi:hypothetical protein
LYGTTKQFLVHFGLNALEDLPSIEEFDGFLGVLQGATEPLFTGPTTTGAEISDAIDFGAADTIATE